MVLPEVAGRLLHPHAQRLAQPAKVRLRLGKAADKEPSGNEENYGNGDLNDDQDFTCREAPVRRLAERTGWSGLQDRGEIEPRRVQGGNQGKEDCGEQRHAQGETEHACIRL